MASSKKAIPVILCGASEVVGRPVAMGIKPEYEVIRFIMGPTNAQKELPQWVSGPPATLTGDADTIGSGDFSQPPQAVVLGGAFSEDLVQDIRKQCADGLSVPWLIKDDHKSDPDMPPPGGPGYADAVIVYTKKMLDGLQEKGLMGKDGLYRW